MTDRKNANILSIDWDYFIDTTAYNRLMLFPDGGNENLSQIVGISVWGSRYGQSEDILKMGVLEPELKTLKSAILRSTKRPGVQFMIVDSHRHAYNFVHDIIDQGGFTGINLINVDFHHDVYQIGEDSDTEVDCGNWLRHLMTEFPGEDNHFTWVARDDSDTYMKGNLSKRLKTTTDITKIFDYQYDGIFICRSAMWSPPHLDERFYRAFRTYAQKYPTLLQEGIFSSRYGQTKKIANQYRSIMSLHR